MGHKRKRTAGLGFARTPEKSMGFEAKEAAAEGLAQDPAEGLVQNLKDASDPYIVCSGAAISGIVTGVADAAGFDE